MPTCKTKRKVFTTFVFSTGSQHSVSQMKILVAVMEVQVQRAVRVVGVEDLVDCQDLMPDTLRKQSVRKHCQQQSM